MVKLNYAVQTNQGKVRNNNEDNYYWNGIIREDVTVNSVSFDGSTEEKITLAAVCDGMGGAADGERASLIAVQNLKPGELSNVHENALASIKAANDEICAEIVKQEGKRMGTTLAALYIDGTNAVCCNVGDSRVYMLRDDILKQISIDHSQVQQLLTLGMITPEEARKHRCRHVITQYLGIFEDEMVIEPAFSEEIRLQNKDRFLLCSDGLSDMVRDEEIKEILKAGSPKECAQKLVDLALDHGGKDNVTVIVIEVEKKGIKDVVRQIFGG